MAAFAVVVFVAICLVISINTMLLSVIVVVDLVLGERSQGTHNTHRFEMPIKSNYIGVSIELGRAMFALQFT